MSTATQHRGRVASLHRSRSADDPELIEARRDLAEANLASYIERVVSKAPPLTDQQRARLAALLGGPGSTPVRVEGVAGQRSAVSRGDHDHGGAA